LGHEADERILASEELRGVLQLHGEKVALTGLGRYTIGAVVDALTSGTTATIANPIKIEAVLACEELELPTPDIRIDDSERSGG
jgi:serine/threonine-protein kinase